MSHAGDTTATAPPPVGVAGVRRSLGRLGLLTAGEAPREDVEATLRAVLGGDLDVVHAGALDGLDDSARAGLAPRPGETPFETRRADGSGVVVAKERLLPLLVARVEEQLAACRRVLLLCSGTFDGLPDRCPQVVQPKPILSAVVATAAAGRVLGVVGPETDVPHMAHSWGDAGAALVCAAASPYGSDAEIVAAAHEVVGQGADVLLLDCIGFTDRHRDLVADAVQRPVICATTVIARLLPELL